MLNSDPLFSQNLKLLTTCPLCRSGKKDVAVRILDEIDDKHLLFVRCRRCVNSFVALVMNTPMGITSIGIVTDLTPDEVVKFRDNEVVESDDVLRLHQFFEKGGRLLEEINQ